MKTLLQYIRYLILLLLVACESKQNSAEFNAALASIDLARGDIALCSSEAGFGTVKFSLSCLAEVRDDFNLATALLHSFEYVEAEKVYTRIIEKDPTCLMAYWGAAMCNFHPLWTAPTEMELEKGEKIISLARSRNSPDSPERDYLEAIAVIYDEWNELSHTTRLLKFEAAAEKIYKKYPNDKEAAIFYALALRAAADPTDKTFAKQIKAGAILNSLFPDEPNHPGIAHYIIHTYDYPELAERALPAARKYASIAAASAHAQHMPSHIFTRLGLWDESVQSNLNSVSAARCYAENANIKGHWDEEIHGLDYLVYAYLQQGKDSLALAQLDYVKSIDAVFPINGKDAYSLASIPTRCALERKDWETATTLSVIKANIDWEKYLWERAIIHLGRALGFIHLKNNQAANAELEELRTIQSQLVEQHKSYEANQVMIQVKEVEAWMAWSKGNEKEAIQIMMQAADMEDATEKHPVTPGEVLPAREMLGDLYLEMNRPKEALVAYGATLLRHPGRFNSLYGLALAELKLGHRKEADQYFQQLANLLASSHSKREAVKVVKQYLDRNS